MQDPTDLALVIDMQRGNRAAMEAFFRRYSPYLYGVCMRYVSDHALAKDLLHDAFIKIFTSIGAFVPDRSKDGAALSNSIKAWAACIAANLALNYIRDNKRLQFVDIDTLPPESIPDDDIDAERLPAEAIMRLIQDLPAAYRTVFNLYAIEGYSHREISKALDISEAASATQYHRAKRMLREKILKYLETTM